MACTCGPGQECQPLKPGCWGYQAKPQTTKKPCPICDAWSCSCAKEVSELVEQYRPFQATDLDSLISRSRKAVAEMTPEQREAMLRAQRRSYVIAEMGMGDDEDEFAYRAALVAGGRETIKRLDAEAVERMARAERTMREMGI